MGIYNKMNIEEQYKSPIDNISSGAGKVISGVVKSYESVVIKGIILFVKNKGHIEHLINHNANVYKEDYQLVEDNWYRYIIDRLYFIGSSVLFLFCLCCAALTVNKMFLISRNFFNLDVADRDQDAYRKFFGRLSVGTGMITLLYKLMSNVYPHVLQSVTNIVSARQTSKYYINKIFDIRDGAILKRRGEQFIVLRDEDSKEVFIQWKDGRWFPHAPKHLLTPYALQNTQKLVGASSITKYDEV